MTCADIERDLDAFIDRELDAEEETGIREHLAGCASCGRRIAERDALGRLVRSLPYSAAPDRLRARVIKSAAATAWSQPLTAWAAAALVVISIGGGVTLFRSATARDTAIVDEVVSGHVRSLMADHLFDVRSTDQHTVKPWFLGKLDFAPPVADLASIGFPLVGGRIDYVGGRPVAALVYQRQKHTINVFVSPASGAASPAVPLATVRGFHVRRWSRDGMAFWAVSDLNDAELTEFARALAGT
jgi:anti-sigma factor RsiW